MHRLGMVALAAMTISAPNNLVVAEEAPSAAKPPAVTQAAPGIKREILQKFDVPGTNYETLIMRVRFETGVDIPRHTHPGPEGSYVLEGELIYLIDGHDPVPLTVGGSITLPANVIHSAKVGPKGVVILGSYIVEKGKPFMTKIDPPATP